MSYRSNRTTLTLCQEGTLRDAYTNWMSSIFVNALSIELLILLSSGALATILSLTLTLVELMGIAAGWVGAETEMELVSSPTAELKIMSTKRID